MMALDLFLNSSMQRPFPRTQVTRSAHLPEVSYLTTSNKNSSATFPLSCARWQTGHETSTYKKTWSAHKCFFQSVFAQISCTSFHIQINSGQMLHKRNFLCTQTSKY